MQLSCENSQSRNGLRAPFVSVSHRELNDMVNEIAGTPTGSAKRMVCEGIFMKFWRYTSFQDINFLFWSDNKIRAGVVRKPKRPMRLFGYLFNLFAHAHFASLGQSKGLFNKFLKLTKGIRQRYIVRTASRLDYYRRKIVSKDVNQSIFIQRIFSKNLISGCGKIVLLV